MPGWHSYIAHIMDRSLYCLLHLIHLQLCVALALPEAPLQSSFRPQQLWMPGTCISHAPVSLYSISIPLTLHPTTAPPTSSCLPACHTTAPLSGVLCHPHCPRAADLVQRSSLGIRALCDTAYGEHPPWLDLAAAVRHTWPGPVCSHVILCMLLT